jgi:PAS domain S-box-containing protein
MTSTTIQPTGIEVFFDVDDIIVSKANLLGTLTYTNQVFLDIAEYTEEEVLGQPHNLIRHPDMPRCVFKLLWDTIQSGKEIFAYVVNMTKTGDHYWVYAHVTPTFGYDGKITGYHSNRRVPERAAVEKVSGIYKALLAEENANGSTGNQAVEASTQLLLTTLEGTGMDYDEFVFSL